MGAHFKGTASLGSLRVRGCGARGDAHPASIWDPIGPSDVAAGHPIQKSSGEPGLLGRWPGGSDQRLGLGGQWAVSLRQTKNPQP